MKKLCRGCGTEKDTGARNHFCSLCQNDILHRSILMKSKCKEGHVYGEVGILQYVENGRKRWRCKECLKNKPKKQWENEETRISMKKYSKKSRLEKIYGLTISDWELMYEKQNKCCAICGKVLKDVYGNGIGKQSAVDHDHKTGRIRGLLCRMPCNYVLGYLHDKVEIFKSCSVYLDNPPAYEYLDIIVPDKKYKSYPNTKSKWKEDYIG